MSLKALDRQKHTKTVLDITERTADREKLLSEFLGLKISESDIGDLESGFLKVQTNEETGEKTLHRVIDNTTDSFQHRYVAFLAARGFRNVEIADITNYNINTISRILKTPAIRELTMQLQDDFFASLKIARSLSDAKLAGSLPDSVEKAIHLMEHADDERVQLQAARLVMEAARLFDREKEQTHESATTSELINIIIEKCLVTQNVSTNPTPEKPEPKEIKQPDGTHQTST